MNMSALPAGVLESAAADWFTVLMMSLIHACEKTELHVPLSCATLLLVSEATRMGRVMTQPVYGRLGSDRF